MDEGSTDACVTVTAEEGVGVAMNDGTLTILVDLVVTAAVSVEGGRMVEDVRHAKERKQDKGSSVVFACLASWHSGNRCALLRYEGIPNKHKSIIFLNQILTFASSFWSH